MPEFSGGSSSGTGSGGSGSGGTDETAGSPTSGVGDGVVVQAEKPAPVDAAFAAVYDAYVAFWTEDAAVLADPSRSVDALTALLAEPQRTRTLDFITSQRAAGLTSAGAITVAPNVIFQDGNIAQVDDCLDDSGLSSVTADGAAVPDSAGARQPVRVTLAAGAAPGEWLVQDLQDGDESSCA